jgi:leucyl aminopeptidase
VINEPSNFMTPTELARRAEDMAEKYGLGIDVLDEARMKDLGMGALLGVSQGSAEPARLIVLSYLPNADAKETIAIVGKGITFDTGGISLKPADGMEKMKYDMAGGATTIAAMRAIAQLKPAVNVIGIIAACENMPGGRAQRPGDVVRSMAGKTIEVINTDAEGRLVLADALAYALKLGATRIVDMATLTGAVSIALGDVNVAILGNNQEWIDEVIAAVRGLARSSGNSRWIESIAIRSRARSRTSRMSAEGKLGRSLQRGFCVSLSMTCHGLTSTLPVQHGMRPRNHISRSGRQVFACEPW